MELHLIFSYFLASVLICVTPGPTVMMAIAAAAVYGKRATAALISGVLLGDLTVMLFVIGGLQVLLKTHALLFDVLQIIGALYLVYLGIQVFRKTSQKLTSPEAFTDVSKTASLWPVFFKAYAVTATNPKTVVFFTAFFPQFITLTMPLLPQYLILVSVFLVVAGVNIFSYVFFVSHLLQKISAKAYTLFNQLNAGFLIVIGGMALFVKILRG